MKTNLHEYFAEARNVILVQGWWQGSYNGPAGQKCLLGALSAITEKNDYIPIWNYQNTWEKVIDIFHILGIDSPADWNDKPNRTEKEVLELLDMATSLCMSENK